MNQIFQKDAEHCCMIPEYSVPDTETYTLHMLAGNQIPGLLPVSSLKIDGMTKLRYDITGCQNLAERYSSDLISGREMKKLLQDLQKTITVLGDYLLFPDDVCLEPDMIYLPEEGDARFCYLPGFTQSGQGSLRELGEFFLRRLDHKDRQAVETGYGFYEEIHAENSTLTQVLAKVLSAEKLEPAQNSREDCPQIHVQESRQIDAQDPTKDNLKDHAKDHAKDNAKNPMETSGTSFLPPEEVDDKVFLREELPQSRRDIRVKKRQQEREKEHQKTHPKKQQDTETRKFRRVICLIVLLESALYACAAVCLRPDLTQLGGLAFLLASVTYLAVRVKQNKKDAHKNRWVNVLEDINEEDAFLEQLMSEVYGPGEGAIREQEDEDILKQARGPFE